MLKVMGRVGAMATLHEEDTLDVDSGVGGEEFTANARKHAVSKAAASVEAAIRSSPTDYGRLYNTYAFDRKADGDYTPAQRHGFKHKGAVLARHRGELNMRDEKDLAAVKYSAASDTVCTSLDAAWVSVGGRTRTRAGARIHTMTSSKAYHHSKPADANDLQARFHTLFGRVQHDMLVSGLDREYAIVVEGPGGDAQDVESVRVEVLADPEWQRDWLFYYDVLDQVKSNLLPKVMSMGLRLPVLARPQSTYQTFGRQVPQPTHQPTAPALFVPALGEPTWLDEQRELPATRCWLRVASNTPRWLRVASNTSLLACLLLVALPATRC